MTRAFRTADEFEKWLQEQSAPHLSARINSGGRMHTGFLTFGGVRGFSVKDPGRGRSRKYTPIRDVHFQRGGYPRLEIKKANGRYVPIVDWDPDE